MSTASPDDPPPPAELQGLDPKDLLNAGLETVPPVTLPPQPVDPDATIAVSRPQPTQPAAQVELPLPEELTKLLPGGNYHVESFLGQGGMGAVYRGTQVRLKRPVAIKIMRRDMGKDYDFEARFEREAQAMAKLNHPNIVSVIDFGEAGPDYLYIVMELIDGADLMDVIRGGQMTQEMALSLLPQICDALQFAHDHGIVHRDIKPSNIMLTRDGRIKMADFGLAKRFDAESSFRTQTGTGMGTPDYAAPEQFDPRANIDHRADIYALGVMIYQMITGQLPRGVWKPPSQRAEVAPQWDVVVSRAMQSDPADRYQQANEVKTDVSSIPLGNKSGAGTPARKESAAAGRLRSPEGNARITSISKAPLLFGTIGTVIILAVSAFFALRQPPQRGPLTPVSGTSASNATDSAQGTVRTTLPATAPATISNPPSPISPPPAPALAESGWKPLVPASEWQKYSKGTTDYQGQQVTALREYKDGLLHMSNISFYGTQPFLDGAIRARLVMRTGSEGGGVSARHSGKQRYIFNLADKGTFMVLAVRTPDSQAGKTLGSYRLPKPLQPDEKFTIELRIQGDQLTGLFNGQEVVRATDQRVKDIGKWGIDASDTWFESVEVQPLPAAAVSARQWQDMLGATATTLLPPNPRRSPEGLLFGQSGQTARTAAPALDAAVRMKTTYGRGTRLALVARETASPQVRSYRLLTRGDNLVVLCSEDQVSKQTTDLLTFPLGTSLRVGEDYTLELRAEGQTLTALYNGQFIGRVADARVESGRFGVGVVEVRPDPALIRSLEFLDLTLPSSPSPNLPVSVSWQNALTDSAQLILAGGAQITKDGLVLTSESSRALVLGGRARNDCAIRMRATLDGLRLGLRARNHEQGNHYNLDIPNKTTIRLQRWDNVARKSTLLREFPLPPGFDLNAEHEMELRAEGSTLTVSLDRQRLGTATDGVFKSGSFGVSVGEAITKPVLIKSLDFLELGTATTTSSPTRPASASTIQWQKANWTEEDLKKKTIVEAAGWARIGEKAGASNGWVIAAGGQNVTFKDGVVRLRYRWQGEAIILKIRNERTFGQVRLWGPHVSLGIYLNSAETRLFQQAPLPEPLKVGDEGTLEIAAIGNRLYARLNDSIVVSSPEIPELSPGGFCAVQSVSASFRDVEYAVLDGIPEAEALRLLGVDEKGKDLRGKASTASPSPSSQVSSSITTATKEAPFVNTLGMKFVPVPGTRVLFSIWDARVMDYAAYAAAKPGVIGEWKTQQKDGVPVGREPDHPVVGVSWEDAQAFCQWLTEKETAEGKLTKGAKYRLPTDAEWSTAVGLPPEQGATPEEKSGKNIVGFPWGMDWPTTKKVGNFADETFHAKFPLKRNEKENRDENLWIKDYDDGYATTSPVGAFPANVHGLYDMGGNVWQWCEDWWNAEHKDRVQRGASWRNQESNSLSSSGRGHSLATARNHSHLGFRCVLEHASSKP